MMGNGVLSPEDIVSQARLILEPVPLANESLAAPSETRTRLCCPLALRYHECALPSRLEAVHVTSLRGFRHTPN